MATQLAMAIQMALFQRMINLQGLVMLFVKHLGVIDSQSFCLLT